MDKFTYRCIYLKSKKSCPTLVPNYYLLKRAGFAALIATHQRDDFFTIKSTLNYISCNLQKHSWVHFKTLTHTYITRCCWVLFYSHIAKKIYTFLYTKSKRICVYLCDILVLFYRNMQFYLHTGICFVCFCLSSTVEKKSLWF